MVQALSVTSAAQLAANAAQDAAVPQQQPSLPAGMSGYSSLQEAAGQVVSQGRPHALVDVAENDLHTILCHTLLLFDHMTGKSIAGGCVFASCDNINARSLVHNTFACLAQN